MCTSITLRSNDNINLLARTMDFSFELEPSMVIVPRKYPIRFSNYETINNHYAFMGLSKDIDSNFMFADGINEYGLSAAVLYFEGYASYNEAINQDLINLAPFEVLTYLLATSKDTLEVKEAFKKINILNKILSFIGSTPPLHWVFSDAKGNSIIVEPLKSGIKFHDNTLGVMANSPDLDWHLTNVRNYIGINQNQVEPLTINGLTFKPFGQGSGTVGIPGDFTPPARFLRALYNKLTVSKVNGEDDLVISANACLNSVKIPKGSVITSRNTIDYTQYTSYMVPSSLSYYFTLYHNPKINRINLNDYNLNDENIVNIKLNNKPNFDNLT